MKQYTTATKARVLQRLVGQRAISWYNHGHHDIAIRFVTPEDRHTKRELDLLAARQQVYARAQQSIPLAGVARRATGRQ